MKTIHMSFTKWHKWFAWHPVLINDKLVWGRKVCRRTKTMHVVGGEHDSWWNYYAPLSDWNKLKNKPSEHWII